MPRVLQILALVSLFSSAAAAQSIYVAGAVGADILLVSRQETIGIDGPTGGGESLSGAARLGVVLNQRFGIEVELSRAAELHDESRPGINPLAGLFPAFVPEIESRTQITTISTTGSVRQQVSDNVALAYLGGVVFHRTDSRTEYRGLRGLPAAIGSISTATSLPFVPLGASPSSTAGLVFPFSGFESVQYGAGVVVGFEAHIGVGDHLDVRPGVRMHGLPSTWLVRPGVGVGWTF